MEDNYTNELVEVNTSKSQPSLISGEDTVQLLQDFTGIIIRLSRQVAENNAAKYRAQAVVMIADIQAKMQTELQDINGYYNIREKQEEHFNAIIMSYQEQFNKLTSELVSAENETKAAYLRYSIEGLQSSVDKLLDQLAKNIASEQNTRLKTSDSRSRGLFGFFRK